MLAVKLLRPKLGLGLLQYPDDLFFDVPDALNRPPPSRNGFYLKIEGAFGGKLTTAAYHTYPRRKTVARHCLVTLLLILYIILCYAVSVLFGNTTVIARGILFPRVIDWHAKQTRETRIDQT